MFLDACFVNLTWDRHWKYRSNWAWQWGGNW